MRLLNTRTYELEEFPTADAAPPYAILSHCWGAGEVTFADIQRFWRARAKPGWKKIERACAAARKRYWYAYIWIDTCCIDKSSSAELSEAINSMFAWYQRATLCLVYLKDVRGDEDPYADDSSFRKSRWFTRGWTLQELIAPTSDMIFLSGDWAEIGRRRMLASLIALITNVHEEILLARSRLMTALVLRGLSVAQRMRWAVGRATTRPEDRAYSLMGIFEINIPNIYVEGGERAFYRLQQEIIRDSPDQSIFAWGRHVRITKNSSSTAQPFSGEGQHPTSWRLDPLLAASPDAFEHSGSFTSFHAAHLGTTSSGAAAGFTRELHFFPTNHGIRIQLPPRAIQFTENLDQGATRRLYYAVLTCEATLGDDVGLLALLLRPVNDTPASPEYGCVRFTGTFSCTGEGDPPRLAFLDPKDLDSGDWRMSTVYISTRWDSTASAVHANIAAHVLARQV